MGFRKGYNVGLVLILMGVFLCSNLAYSDTLRVPISEGYDKIDEAMLQELSIPELIEKIYPDYENYIDLLRKFYLIA